MTSRRNQLLAKLLKQTTGEDEDKLYALTIERIIADQVEFYKKFYDNEGEGAIVFMPDSPDKDSMFYLTINKLIKTLNEANNHNLAGKEHLQKAVAIAESLDPEKEALFLIQDQKDGIRLYHFKSSDENNSLKGLIGI